MTSLSTAMASLKLAKEAVNAALSVRDFNAVASTLAGVNDQLLKAQDALFIYSARLAELQEKLTQCQDELRELRRVQSEREKYTLFQISEGIWVYKSNPLSQAGKGVSNAVEPSHYVCQVCFDKGQKVVMQRTGVYYGQALWCPACDTKLPI